MSAAYGSGANVLRVNSVSEVTYNNIKGFIDNIPFIKIPYVSNEMNVLIPMAGRGSRFEVEGYKLPKPLIDVNGIPMIKAVVDNLNIKANYIFVVQEEHRIKYNLDVILNIIAPGCKIYNTSGVTEGAACTALLAKESINSTSPLFIANSDQIVNWSPVEFFYKMNQRNSDGGIVTFRDTNPKWSFCKVDDGIVTKVAEKNPISDIATAGLYYYKHGSDFVKYAEQMIDNDDRFNREFYIAPIYNYFIENQKIIHTFDIEKMQGIGTPEDLKKYLNDLHIA